MGVADLSPNCRGTILNSFHPYSSRLGPHLVWNLLPRVDTAMRFITHTFFMTFAGSASVRGGPAAKFVAVVTAKAVAGSLANADVFVLTGRLDAIENVGRPLLIHLVSLLVLRVGYGEREG